MQSPVVSAVNQPHIGRTGISSGTVQETPSGRWLSSEHLEGDSTPGAVDHLYRDGLVVVRRLGRHCDVSKARCLHEVGIALRTHGEHTHHRSAERSSVLSSRAVSAPGHDLDHLLADPTQVDAQADEHLGPYAFPFSDESQQKVLGADVAVAELLGLA